MAKSSTGSGGKKGKKNRKHLRNKMRSPSAKAYKAEGRYEKNKKKKRARHLVSHPDDRVLSNIVVDYKVPKLTPEQTLEMVRIRAWKRYLRSA